MSKDLGARFMVTHGAVADYALVAEGTGFEIVGIEPGKAHFKVTVFTDTSRYYTPYLPRPTGMADAPNAIVRTAVVIEAFERWAYSYQLANTYESPNGTIVPKASINAIRSGYPYSLTSAPQLCSFYVDTRILPGANPLDLRDQLRALLRDVGVDGTVELFLYRPGFEAKGAERLIETVRRVHDQVFDTPPAIVGEPVTSMWRDTNAFNELGIPAISYAPRSASHAARKSFKVKDGLTGSAVAGRGGHYGVLEVLPGATHREIRAAYRRLAMATHPDGHAGDPGLERRFKRIAKAYEVLGDLRRRQAYDERLTRGRFAAPGTGGAATFSVDTGPIYHSDLGHHSDF